jgi:magnesium-dependent phosphatase 1
MIFWVVFSILTTSIFIHSEIHHNSPTFMATALTVKTCNKVKLVAFDLDGTVWSPDMYELWGGGAPFTVVSANELRDSKGTKVRLLGAISSILHELHTAPEWKETKVAWVSCTDEPSWAAECLRKFQTMGGTPIGDVVHSEQIFKSNKQTHFQRLKKLYPEIAFEEMLFFDNEYGNISNVEKLGIKSVYCPDGMTREIWEKGLSLFRS